MNVWTAVLESLHSALIDELVERHPEPKPTLGMPVRQRQPVSPVPGGKVLLCELLPNGEGPEAVRGAALLAFDPGFMKALGIGHVAFWQALLKRAGTEFQRRQIQPRIGNPVEIPAGTAALALPAGYGEPTRVIWVPFQIPEGTCHLGLIVC
ncbi:MAG: hypothetical protein NDJ89_02835 [Oligoflexia bacterium]|nr:hypothetical protein [Oligoflexia bacterium]